MIEQTISLVGAILILAAYAAQQVGKLDARGYAFLILNFVGAGILTVVAFRGRQVGLTLVEGAWALISITMILRKYFDRRRNQT